RFPAATACRGVRQPLSSAARAVALMPSDVNAEAAIGVACAARGDWVAAVPHFRRALAAAPGLYPAVRLGVALCLAGDDFGFLALLRSVTADEPQFHLFHEV